MYKQYDTITGVRDVVAYWTEWESVADELINVARTLENSRWLRQVVLSYHTVTDDDGGGQRRVQCAQTIIVNPAIFRYLYVRYYRKSSRSIRPVSVLRENVRSTA